MNEHYEFVNKPLPYAFDALEPYIDEKTMQLHHDKHLQTYVNNLNSFLKDYPELQKLTLEELLDTAMFYPPEIRVPLVNNAGGVYNHQFYFSMLSPPGTPSTETNRPEGLLEYYIDIIFGSFDSFMETFTQAALSVFGSGYAWLVSGEKGILGIVTTPNQNTPPLRRNTPILNIDVWEHAYYLKHYNVRADYIKDWFRVVNWEQADRNFMSCVGRNRLY